MVNGFSGILMPSQDKTVPWTVVHSNNKTLRNY